MSFLSPLRIAALTAFAALCLVSTTGGCGGSGASCDGDVLEVCGEHCSEIGVCHDSCEEFDCRAGGAACAEGNDDADCVLPSLEACDPSGSAVFRCTADGTRVEECSSTGYWTHSTTCGHPGKTCKAAKDGSNAICVLDPAEDCSQDPTFHECRGLTYVDCNTATGFLQGQDCPTECVADSTQTSGGYVCQ